MKLKNLLKGCMNTIDSVCILGINKAEAHRRTNIQDIYALSDRQMSAEVC